MGVDWSEMKLGDFVELKRGYDLPKKNRKDGLVPVVSSAGESGSHDVAKVKAPGVITGRYGTIGKVYYIEKDFWPLNTTLYVKDFKGNNPLFVYYFLKTINYFDYSDKAAVPGINRNHLHTANIRVPINSEHQKYLALYLWNLDQKIELNRQINQTLEDMAKAIFKSWFVDFEPVKAKIEAKVKGQDHERAAMCAISGKSDTELNKLSPDQIDQLRTTAALFPDELTDSGLGLIPNGWEVMTLGNCKLEIESGKRPKGGIDKSLDHGVPSVGAESVSPIGNFDYSKVKYVTDEFALTAKKGWVQNLDVALYKDGGKPGLFKPRVSLYGNSFPFERFMINEHVFLLRSELLGPYFLFYTISSARALDQLIAKASAKAAQPGLNQSEVKGTHFLYPGDDIVKCFNRLLSPNVSKQHANGLENQALSNLRDTLLPKLLSGEIEIGQED